MPGRTWQQLVAGNERFIRGEPEHPRQDAERRTAVSGSQHPKVAIFGCSDSRLSAEIIFDIGLGDAFVVRNAGQVISDSVVGSLEYAVSVLDVHLILVLGHDSCGAVRAAIDSVGPEARPLPPHIHDLISPIVPAVRRVAQQPTGAVDPSHIDELRVGQEHLRDTIAELLERSELIGAAIAAGDLAIVGANYRLAEGRAVPDIIVGDISSTPSTK
ncbi:MAG: carbonic anhydrase [Agromyces sp.]